MKLAELEPKWLTLEGRRIGILFRCPHCRDFWLTCFQGPVPRADQMHAWSEATGHALDEDGWPDDEHGAHVSFCDPHGSWRMTGEDFASLSITPSIDASGAGHWHGHISGGEIR